MYKRQGYKIILTESAAEAIKISSYPIGIGLKRSIHTQLEEMVGFIDGDQGKLGALRSAVVVQLTSASRNDQAMIGNPTLCFVLRRSLVGDGPVQAAHCNAE